MMRTTLNVVQILYNCSVLLTCFTVDLYPLFCYFPQSIHYFFWFIAFDNSTTGYNHVGSSLKKKIQNGFTCESLVWVINPQARYSSQVAGKQPQAKAFPAPQCSWLLKISLKINGELSWGYLVACTDWYLSCCFYCLDSYPSINFNVQYFVLCS